MATPRKREAPQPPPVPITSTSETSPLLPGRGSPPPRYSTIGPSWEVPLHGNDNPGYVGDPSATTTTTTPSPAPPPAPQHHPHTQGHGINPGWWSWVPGPAQMIPPGLEHLTGIDRLIIKKRGRRYRVVREGEEVYSVLKMRASGGAVLLRLQNNANLDVLLINSTGEEGGCCASLNRHVEVSFPPGNTVGVVQGAGLEYTVHNPSGDLLYVIEQDNPQCCRKPSFVMATREGRPIGQLERVHIKGCCKGRRAMEMTFPGDLDLHSKALLLAGAVAIRHHRW